MNPTSPLPHSPSVSIILPTYNRPQLLMDAIRSVRSQTYQNFEVIIVNDGGEDVRELIDDFNDERLLYLCHGINSGLSAARNTGLHAAKGKYITFLDDDDIYYQDHLSTLVGYLEDNPGTKVVYSDAVYSIKEKQGLDYIEVGREVKYSIDFDRERMLSGNFIPVLCLMFNRECFKEIGYFDTNLYRLEDWDLWIRMSRSYEFKHIRKSTCEVSWQTDGSTMTSKGQEAMFFAYLTIVSKHKDIIGPETLSNMYHFIDLKLEEFYNVFQEELLHNNFDLIPFFGTDSLEVIIEQVENQRDNYYPRYNLLLLKVLRLLDFIKIKNDYSSFGKAESPLITSLFSKSAEHENLIQEQKFSLINEYEIRIKELKTNLTISEQAVQNLEIRLAEEKANAEQAVQNLEIQLAEEKARAEQAVQNLQKSFLTEQAVTKSRINNLEQKIDDLSREFAEKAEVYESEQKRLNEKNSQLDQEKVLVEAQKAELERAYDFAKKEIVDYYTSTSWKMTRPFRWISKKFRG